MNSGIKRFFSQLEPSRAESETRLHRELLRTAMELDPDWKDVIPDPESMDLVEAVAWFWRYNNEAIYSAGKTHPSYHYVIYERLVQDPISVAKDVYGVAGIPWTEQTEAVIARDARSSMWGELPSDHKAVAKVWKDKLSPEHQAIAERVLTGSLFETWWD